MNTFRSAFLLFATSLLFTSSCFAELFQKRYDFENGLYEVESERLVKLVPASKFDHPSEDSLPYVVVGDGDYKNTLKLYEGFHDKPDNHVLIRNRETIVLRTKDLDSEKYKQREEMVDGVKTLFLPEPEIQKYLIGKKTAPGLPKNYILVGVDVIQVLPAK